MKQKTLVLAMSTALLAMSQVTHAGPIVINSSLAEKSWLNAGQHTGWFDGTALLPASFQINSAVFRFDFSDDFDAMTEAVTGTTTAVLSDYQITNTTGWGSDLEVYHTRESSGTKTANRVGEQESAILSISGSQLGHGSTTETIINNQIEHSTNQIFDAKTGQNGKYTYYRCGIFGIYRCSYYTPGRWDYYYTKHTVQTTANIRDWTGNFSITGVIDDKTMLNALLNSKSLQWDLGVHGDLFLNKAQLIIDVEPTPAASQLQVSAPSSFIAALSGLLCLAGLRRRQSSLPRG